MPISVLVAKYTASCENSESEMIERESEATVMPKLSWFLSVEILQTPRSRLVPLIVRHRTHRFSGDFKEIPINHL